MNNSLKTLVVLALIAFAGLANAQNSAQTTVTANATVICPISIKDNTNLEFGTITNSATGGNEVVPPNGSPVYTTVAATTGSHAGSTPHSADLTITGQGNYSYLFTPTVTTDFSGGPATLINLTWANGSGGNSKSLFPCDSDNDNDSYSGDFSDDKCGCVTDHIKLGGEILLTSAANGIYSATVTAAIAYN